MTIKRLTIWQRQHRAQVNAARARAQRCDAQIQALLAERDALNPSPHHLTSATTPARQHLQLALARGEQHRHRTALATLNARLETLTRARADALTALRLATARLDATTHALHRARRQHARRLAAHLTAEDDAS